MEKMLNLSFNVFLNKILLYIKSGFYAKPINQEFRFIPLYWAMIPDTKAGDKVPKNKSRLAIKDPV